MPDAFERTFDVDDEGNLPKRVWHILVAQVRAYAGGRVQFRVSKPRRSTKANNFYWGFRIDPIHQAALAAGIGTLQETDPRTGEVKSYPLTDEAIHFYMKRKYLPVRTLEIGGQCLTMEPTTTTLDETSFHDYVLNVENDPMVLELGVLFDEDVPTGLRSYRIAEPTT